MLGLPSVQRPIVVAKFVKKQNEMERLMLRSFVMGPICGYTFFTGCIAALMGYDRQRNFAILKRSLVDCTLKVQSFITACVFSA